MSSLQEIQNIVNAAIECSYFIEPTDPGLSFSELREITSRLGYYEGETNDAISHLNLPYNDKRRMLLGEHRLIHWVFMRNEEPDYRNFEAFDFVINDLNQRVRQDGYARAQIERSLLVERAISGGFGERDVQLAITYLVGAKIISEQAGMIRFPGTAGSTRDLPSKTLLPGRAEPKPLRAKTYPIVQDIIARREDGRLPNVEPLDAFAHQLTKLGYGQFRLWWTQTATEMRISDPAQAPASVTVLAAALVEGVLTFVVKHARSLDLPVFKSKDFDGQPRSWKIDDLVNSAATGGPDAILDPSTKSLAAILIRNRQRIHAGRMLVDHPQGVPDIKSDEVRLAKSTAEQVVRRVLDWLERHPPA